MVQPRPCQPTWTTFYSSTTMGTIRGLPASPRIRLRAAASHLRSIPHNRATPLNSTGAVTGLFPKWRSRAARELRQWFASRPPRAGRILVRWSPIGVEISDAVCFFRRGLRRILSLTGELRDRLPIRTSSRLFDSVVSNPANRLRSQSVAAHQCEHGLAIQTR